MANPPPMLPGLGFPVDSEIDLLRKWTWNTWLWAQEDFQPSDIPGLQAYYDAWELQRLGVTYLQAVPEWPDLSGNGWHAVQATGSLQPRFLDWAGQNYLHGPGVTGNNATCPGVTNTGSFGVRAKYAPPGSWDSGTVRRLQRQTNSAGQRKYAFQVNGTGRLTLSLYLNATDGTGYTSTAAVPFASGEVGYVGAFWDQSAGEIVFETSADGVTWTQLGSAVAASTATNGDAVAYPICVLGNIDVSLQDGSAGKLFWTTYSLTHGGAPIRYFNAALGNANSATIPSATGETWTINTSGANPARIVSAPDVLLDGTDDFMELPAGALGMLRNVPGATSVITSKSTNLTGSKRIFWASNGLAGSQARHAQATNGAAYYLQGRRLDANSVQDLSGGTPVINTTSCASAISDWSNALAYIYANGSQVAVANPWQTAGNSEDTDSVIIRLGLNAGSEYFAGSISNLVVYNRALSDAEIRAVSRFLAARARAGIVSA